MDTGSSKDINKKICQKSNFFKHLNPQRILRKKYILAENRWDVHFSRLTKMKLVAHIKRQVNLKISTGKGMLL